MKLEDSLIKIKEFILKRYNDNLAGILVLGSANTGNFKNGISDINAMIFVKEQGELDFNKEIDNLTKELSDYRFQSQYFHSLDSIKKYIKERKSFATYIVITNEDGSRILYTTPEFEQTRNWFREHPFTKQEIKEHVMEKDKFELKGYMSQEPEEKYKNREYRTTQNLLFHLRRKIQIINYFDTNKLIFDFNKCLSNTNIDLGQKSKLSELYVLYKDREQLSGEQEKEYFNLARELTNKIRNL